MLTKALILALCTHTPDPHLHTYIAEASQTYHVSEPLIFSVIVQESGCNTNATNGPAIGLGQINTSVWPYKNLKDPRTNVLTTAKILAHYGADTEYVTRALTSYLGAYNTKYIQEIKDRVRYIRENL